VNTTREPQTMCCCTHARVGPLKRSVLYSLWCQSQTKLRNYCRNYGKPSVIQQTEHFMYRQIKIVFFYVTLC